MEFNLLHISLLFPILGWRWVEGLKGVNLTVSEAVKAGETLRLTCDYDLEMAPLYSIKWYFVDDEFYRYVPKESPPSRIFPLPGINVDVSSSNDKQVTLKNVRKDLSGFYKCEVSADAPSFHTDMKSALVVVTEEPKKGPVVITDKLKYSNVEKIRANCSCYEAFPAVNLTWYLNGNELQNAERCKITSQIVADVGGSETTRSYLELESVSGLKGRRRFINGIMVLTCEATQFGIFSRKYDVKLTEYTPQLARVLSPSSPNVKHPADNGSEAKVIVKWAHFWPLVGITVCSLV